MDKIITATTPINREISEYLLGALRGNSQLGAFKALEVSVRETSRQFESIPNLEISAGIIKDNIVYISAYGGGIVRLVRKGQSSNILVSEPREMLTASGFLERNDKIFFETKDKVETFEKEPFFNKFFKKKTYIVTPPIDDKESKNRKTTLTVGILLLLILGVSIFFGLRQKRADDLRGKYEGILTEATKNLDEAVGLSSVSPDKAREAFVLAQEKLAQIEALNIKNDEIEKFKKRIEEEKFNVFGEYSANPELFLDLTLLSSGFNGTNMSFSQGNLFVLDKNSKKVASVKLDSKKSKIIAGPDEVNEATDLASYNDRVFVLSGGEVKEVGGKNQVVIKKDDLFGENGGDGFIFGFAGNLYVLDKQNGQIYRYQGSGESFGGKQNWLSDATKPDFSKAKSWVIDGSIYVLGSTGKIQKFSQGSPQAFSLAGIYPSIDEVEAIYANDETEFVYILDKIGKRVVVVDKKGVYKAQYKADEIENAKGLVVSEKDKLIILLTGEKLMSLNLH